MSSAHGAWLIGRGVPDTLELARTLDAELVEVPEDPRPSTGDDWTWPWAEELAQWGREVRTKAPRDRVVVCSWAPAPLPGTAPVTFAEQSVGQWMAAGEWALACWFEAAVAGAQICADGGSLVVVAERPAALDVVGQGDTVLVAEGLVTLARSLGICEGDRGVRVNAVLTELTTAPQVLLGLAPLLPTFPGSAGVEVAGAVRMLWSQDAAGVTGTAVRADCGRSW
jgi:hypothetical protein